MDYETYRIIVLSIGGLIAAGIIADGILKSIWPERRHRRN